VHTAIARVGASWTRFGWGTDPRTVQHLEWLKATGRKAVVGNTGDPAVWVPQILASPYASVVDALEGRNEPDLFDGADWLQKATVHQRALYDAAAGRWPVLSPAAGRPANDAALLALPHDIANFHRYPGNGAPTAAATALPKTCVPAWVTETGQTTYKTWYGSWVVSPAQQAVWLPQMIDGLRAAGAERVYVHELLNLKVNWSSYMQPNDNWGLFTYYGEPKPVVAALR
jgi:hypothetical protein